MTSPRRRGWLLLLVLALAAWMLNASRMGRRVQGCPDGCSATGSRRDGPLRVMSLNVLHGFRRFEHLSARVDLIADEIRRLDADIVCLQEVPWTWRLGDAAEVLARSTGLNHLYLRANGNRWAILFEEGVAILSRYPLREVAFAELSPRAEFFEHRVVLKATVATDWGDVRVFVTHLTDGAPEINLAQADSLVAFVAEAGEGTAVTAGDFNAREQSPQMQAISEQWVDTFRTANPDDPGFTCCIADLTLGPQEPLEKRIDYLFLVSEAARTNRVVRSQLVLDHPFPVADRWQWASDHVGLLTTLAIERRSDG